MYVLLELWQKIMAIPIMNPLLWFMITLVLAGIEPTAKLVNHCLSTWFRQECTTSVPCLLLTPVPSPCCKEPTKADIH